MHKHLTVAVDELCTERTNLFGDERTEYLLRIGSAGGMILKRIGIKQLCADTVPEHQAVRRCAVMVGGREALVMHSSRTACRYDNGFRTGDHKLMRFHIHKHGACRFAVFIKYQLDGGGEIHNGNTAVKNLIAQRAHYFRAGIILCGMHSLAGCTAAVGGYHSAVGRFVELHAEPVEPLYSLRSITYELCKKLALGGIMSATVCIDKVYRRGIVRLVGSLNAALRHHGVCITHAELCDYHCLGSGVIRLYSRGSARTAAADDKHIDIVTYVVQIDIAFRNTAVRLQKLAQLMRNRFALVGPYLKNGKLAFFVIGVISRKQLILFVGRHTRRFAGDIRFSCGFDGFQRFLKFL